MYNALDPKDIIKTHVTFERYCATVVLYLKRGHDPKRINFALRKNVTNREIQRLQNSLVKTAPRPPKQRNLSQVAEFQGWTEMIDMISSNLSSLSSAAMDVFNRAVATLSKFFQDLLDVLIVHSLVDPLRDYLANKIQEAYIWITDIVVIGLLTWREQWIPLGAFYSSFAQRWSIKTSALVWLGAVALQLVKQLTQASAEMQAGSPEDDESFLGSLSALFYGFVHIIKPKTDLVDFVKGVEPYSKLVSATNTALTLAEKLTKYVRIAFGYVYKLITGHAYLTVAEKLKLEQLHVAVEQLQTAYKERDARVMALWHSHVKVLAAEVGSALGPEEGYSVAVLLDTTSGMNGFAANTPPMDLAKSFDECLKRVRGGEDLEPVLKEFEIVFHPHRLNTNSMTYYSNRVRDLRAARTAYLKKTRSKQTRVKTFIVCFKGGARLGKDTLCGWLFPIIGAMVDPEFSVPYTYSRDVNFQTYDQELSVHMSDFLQFVDQESQKKDIGYLWKLRETSPQLHDSPDVDSKATNYDRTQLALITTNNFIPKNVPVTTPEALARSFDKFYEMELNDEYAVGGRLDHARVKELVRNHNIPELNKVWRFYTVDALGMNRSKKHLVFADIVDEIVSGVLSRRKDFVDDSELTSSYLRSGRSVTSAIYRNLSKPLIAVAHKDDQEPSSLKDRNLPEEKFYSDNEDLLAEVQMRIEDPERGGFTSTHLANLLHLVPELDYDYSDAARAIVLTEMKLPMTTPPDQLHAAMKKFEIAELAPPRVVDALLTSRKPLPVCYRAQLRNACIGSDLSKITLADHPDRGFIADPRGTRRADYHYDYLMGELTAAKRIFYFARDTPLVAGAVVTVAAGLIAGITFALTGLSTQLGETQARSEYNPVGSVQVTKRRLELKPTTYAMYQNVSLDDQYMQGILANLRVLEIEHGKQRYVSSGTIIRGRLLETVAHAFADSSGVRHPPDAIVRIYAGGSPFQCYFRELRIAKANKDYAVALLPSNYSFGKDISSRLATAQDLTTLPRFNVLIGRQLTSAGPAFINQGVGDVLNVADVTYKGFQSQSVAPNMLHFRADTQKGDCGAIYMTGDSHFGQGSRKLFGVHSLGIPGNRAAFAVPRTREDFEALASLLNDRSPSEEESPTYVTSTPAEQQNQSFQRFNTQGFISKSLVPHVPTETEIRQSLVQKASFVHPEIWPAPRTAPVILRRTADHDPYLAAAVKIRETTIPWDPRVVECYNYALNATIGDFGSPVINRPLTWHETFNGLPSYGVTRLPLGTSLGFRGNLFPRVNYRNRRDLFVPRSKTPPEILAWAQAPAYGTDDDIYPVPELYHELKRVEALARANTAPFTIWIDQVKDERKLKEKVKKGRIFSFPPIAQNLLYRKYGAFIGITIGDPTRRIFNGWAYKVNPESIEWEVLYNEIKATHYIDGDMGEFDAATPSQFNAMDLDFVERVLGDSWSQEDMNCLRISIESHQHAVRLTPWGELYQPHQGGISGHALTTPLNMLHQKYNLHAFGYWASNFLLKPVSLKAVNYGDDFICRSDNVDVNYFSFKEFLALTGQKLTPTDKGGVERPFTPEHELALLKRKFSFHDGHIFGALDLNVIYEIPNWILKGHDTEEFATQVNCEMALRSAFGHGRVFFEQFQARLIRAMNIAGVRFRVPFTYDSLLRDYASGTRIILDLPEYQSAILSPPLKADLSRKILPGWVATTPAPGIAPGQVKSLVKEGSFNPTTPTNPRVISKNNTESVERPSLMSGMEAAPSIVSGTTTIESAGTLAHSVSQSTPMRGDFNPYPAADELTKALERTYLVKTISWLSTTGDMADLDAIDFPSSLLAFSYLSQKVKDYQYLRYDAIDITISYASNPYLSGTLGVVAIPANLSAIRLTPEVLLNSGATLLCAGKQETVTMRIPNMAYQYLNKLPALIDFEQLHFVVLNSLSSLAGGAPSINLSVYAKFVNPRLIGPEPRATYVAEMQSAVIDEALAKAASGTLTGTPVAGGTIGKVLQTVDTVANIAEIAALSKPISLATPEQSVPALIPGFGSVSGVDTSQRGAYTYDSLVATRGVLPDQTADVTLTDIAKTPCVIARGTFTSTLVKNDVIFSSYVSPCVSLVGTVGAGQPVTLTHASLIAMGADFWRSGMKYMVYFDCSPLITFTARISWFPSTAALPGYNFEGAGGDLIGKIVTVTGPTVVTFTVPYLPFVGFLDCMTDPNDATDANCNGQIVATIVEPVSTPTDISTVNWSLWSAADSDFEIYRANQLPGELTYPGVLAEYQMDVRAVFRSDFDGLVPARTFIERGVNLPESITKIPLAALGKRYARQETINSGNVVASREVSFTAYDTLISRVLSMYFYWRGSVNVKLIYTKLSTDVASPVRRVGLFNNADFCGDGSLNICNPSVNPVIDLSIPFFSPYLANICLPEDEALSQMSNYMTYIFDVLGSSGRDTVDVYLATGEDFSVSLLLAPPYATYDTPVVKKRGPTLVSQMTKK